MNPQFGDSRLPERFWDKCIPDPNGGCWLWIGSIIHEGYGHFRWPLRSRELVYSHRLAFETLNGPIPDDKMIDHLCRVRCCCNPAHLEPVTCKENVARGRGPEVARARMLARTHCKHGHALTPDNIYLWREIRICRSCRRETVRNKARQVRVR